MKQSGRTTLFVLVCIAVLTAAYGVGLGVRKIRSTGINIHFSIGRDEAEQPADRPKSEPNTKPTKDVVATVTAAEPSDEDEAVADAPEEQQEVRAARPEGADVQAKKERFQDLPEEEKQKIIAQKRKLFADKGRGEGRGRGAWQKLSEEDQNTLRGKVEALGAQAKAGEISEEDMRRARSELLQEYGINPQGRGGRRPGGRQ